ncbi:MAG: TonB-dependent receptor [Opitutaceae bacterium]|nr:TonB-dependent receptor [Opitutaceae bacterium]
MNERPAPRRIRLSVCGWIVPCLAVVLGSLAPSRAGEAGLADLSLRELLNVQFDTVSTASRRSQRIWEAPASVSLVTREEIKAFGYRTLADAIAATPGAYTTDDRYYTYLGVRGFSRPGDYNSRVLLLVDGSRANDNIFDSGWVGHESPVQIEDVERVEIIRGPSSSLYGSSAFFGTINVISRRGGSLNGVETSAEASSLRSWRGRAAAGWRFKSGLEIYGAVTRFTTRGEPRLYYAEFDSPATNHGVAEDLDYQRATHFAGNAVWRGFTLSAGYNDRIRGIPTGSFSAAFNDRRSRTRDSSGFVDLKFEHTLPGGTQFMARLGQHRYDYRAAYPYDMAAPGEPPDIVGNHDSARGEWRGLETAISHRFLDRLTLTIGGEWRDNFRQDQLNFDETDPVTVYVDSHASEVVKGVYSQVDWSVLPDLIVSGGARYDHYDSFHGTASPRFGLIYRPWATGAAKVLYGRAFRAPNAYESHYVSAGQNPNPDLRPERIATYEVIFEQQVGQAVKLTASGSRYHARGLIAFDYDPAVYSFQNTEEARTTVAEFGAEGRWLDGWFGRVSYTVQKAEDARGVELSNSPRNLAKAHVRVPLFGGRVWVGTEVQRVGSARTVQPGRTEAEWVANMTVLARELASGFELSASVYNLLDRRVGNTGFDEHRQRIIHGPGRAYRVRLSWSR